MRPGPLLFAALLATLIGVAAGRYLDRRERAQSPASPPALATAPLFAARLPDSHGQEQAIAQWRGRLLVVNFWASWCAPCRAEIPALSRLQAKYAHAGVQIVGIAVDDAHNVADFARNTRIDYPLLIAGAGGGELARQLGDGAVALPYTLIIDRSGAIRNAHLGQIEEARLDALLAAQIARN